MTSTKTIIDAEKIRISAFLAENTRGVPSGEHHYASSVMEFWVRLEGDQLVIPEVCVADAHRRNGLCAHLFAEIEKTPGYPKLCFAGVHNPLLRNILTARGYRAEGNHYKKDKDSAHATEQAPSLTSFWRQLWLR